MSLFDSPNDMQWNSHIDTFKRGSNQTLIGKIVDEKGDGNYLDNMFQKYTVELIGWGQKLYGCKVRIPNAGYNGTGKHTSFKAGDGVLIQTKEGQLDDAIIIGAHRLNGDTKTLEVQGQGQKFGEHYNGSKGTVASSSPPSLHPGRVTKLDSEVYIGGVNNARTPYEDPTEVGDLQSSLDKQPIPGIYKALTKEGVDINYSYGGILHMTDGNYVVMSSGISQNKCSKYLEQAARHNKIASHLKKLTTFATGLIEGVNLTNLDNPNDLKESIVKEGESISIKKESLLQNPITGKTIDSNASKTKKEDEAKAKAGGASTDTQQSKDKKIETYAIKAGSNNYRVYKHTKLAEVAKAQAEECNTNNAAYQYSALLMGNSASIPTSSENNSAPSQGIGHVDANNYSSRNTSNPKPPTDFVGSHPNNYSTKTHTLKYLVMHHSVYDMEKTIATFKDPKRKVSAQYAVGKDGRVVQFVKDTQLAYQIANHNTGKIGIEIIATKPNEGMTKEQEEALIKLSRYLISTYNIPIENVRGHNTFITASDVKTECPTWVFPTQDKLTQWANTYLKV